MVKLRSRAEIKKHIRIVLFLFCIVFVIIAVRAYFLQLLTPQQLSDRIARQNKTVIALTPNRGTIYDRNGMELAVSTAVESLFARAHAIKDHQTAARCLARVLQLPQKKLLRNLQSRSHFLWIKRRLTPLEAARVKALRMEGLEFVQESQRFYPNRELAGQVLGFTGIDSQGLEGLERECDALLKGHERKLVVYRDALGRHLFIEGEAPSGRTQGHDIVLTIDKNIQYIAEKELQAAVERSQAKHGSVVVMDPWTGEILALAVVPQFNPNQYAEYPPEAWRNRVVADVFEPGSTFKTFLIAAALEENLVKPTDLIFCENGSFQVAKRIIHDVHPHGWLTVSEIIKYSSNIGASKISRQLGKDLFHQYIRKFGFGEETGVQMPAEVSGHVPGPYRLSEHTQSTIAFGQGLSATPLQLAAGYAAIANGGALMRPYIISKIVDANGLVIQENRPAIRHRVLTEETARAVGQMLQAVVSEGGTGTLATVSGFTVAGKTGTSQKLEDDGRGYSSRKIVGSFAGFAPAQAPRITVVVTIDEPQTVRFGGEIAAPVFSRVCQGVLTYLGAVPDSPVKEDPMQWSATKVALLKGEQSG